MEESSFASNKILITGGCGFIGSHLTHRMLMNGAEVFILSRNISNSWRIKDKINAVHLIQTDITNTNEVNKCIIELKPDYVFHLAAYGVDSSQKDYDSAVSVNIKGTINLLEALKETGCKKFINLGTCAEYGDRQELLCEYMNPQPVSVYGSTKACATIMAHQIAKENHLPIVTLRPFGIFGEGEARHKIFCHIIMSILENTDVKLTSCEQYRDYCYIENIIDGLIMAAESPKACHNIFNIASGKLYPLKYYVELIFKNISTDKKPLYGAIEYRKNEMWAPRADISEIQAILGWKPKISIEEGLIKTMNWYKKNKNYV